MQGVAGNIVGEALSPAVTAIAVAQGARRSGRGTSESLRDVGSLRALFSAQGLAMVAVGSRDPNRFYPGMGTLFLRMMGEAFGAALARYADRPAD